MNDGEVAPARETLPKPEQPFDTRKYVVVACAVCLQEIQHLPVMFASRFGVRESLAMNLGTDVPGTDHRDGQIQRFIVQQLCHLNQEYLGCRIRRIIGHGAVCPASSHEHGSDFFSRPAERIEAMEGVELADRIGMD